jgi:hypothetical protein
LWDFAKSFELPDFVGCVFHDDVAFLVLELPERAHEEIADSNPDFLSHFASDVSDSFDFIEALDKDSSVS